VPGVCQSAAMALKEKTLVPKYYPSRKRPMKCQGDSHFCRATGKAGMLNQGIPRGHIGAVAAVFFIFACTWIAPNIAQANSFADATSVSLTNQGIFGGTGTAAGYDEFLGAQWGLQFGGIGGIADTSFGSFGAALGGVVFPGQFGIDVNALFTSGTLNYNQNVTANVDYAPSDFNRIDYNTDLTLGAGSFTSGSLQYSASVDLRTDLHVFVGAELCAFGCVSASGDLINIDSTLPLVSFNKTPGVLELLGIPVSTTNSVFHVTDPTGITTLLDVTAPLAPANILGIPTDLSGKVLAGSGSGTLFDINARFLNILTFTTGMPPLSGNIGGILDYNVLNASGDLKITLHQDISISTAGTLTLNVAETGDSIPITLGSVGSSVLNFNGLTTFPSSVTVTPRIDYTARITNRTYLSLDPSFKFSVGELSAPSVGLQVGPLYSTTYAPPSIDFDVYNTFFDVPLKTITYQSSLLGLCGFDDVLPRCASPSNSHPDSPINLFTSNFGSGTGGPGNIFDPDNGSQQDFNGLFQHQPQPTAEPGSLLLLGSGAAALAKMCRKRKTAK
jgi:hypothetical protein